MLLPSIQVTFDCPSKHPEGRMPLLDLEVWVDDEEEVVFSFFEKPMASRYTIPVRSAHSWKQKVTNLTREAIRRLLNIHNKLPWTETVKIMNKFSRKMKKSGYSARVRKQILKSSKSAYRKIRRN